MDANVDENDESHRKKLKRAKVRAGAARRAAGRGKLAMAPPQPRAGRIDKLQGKLLGTNRRTAPIFLFPSPL